MVLSKLAGLALALVLQLDPFSFEYPGQTDASGTVSFVIQANEDMEDLDIVIKGDGQTIRKSLSGLKAGQRQTLTWKQKGAHARYELEISGKGEAVFSFEVVKAQAPGKVGTLKVKSTREDIVKRNTATFETSFALSNYEYKIYDGDGDTISSGLVTDPVPAGGTFSIKWDSPAEVFMVFVRGEDEHGRFTEYKLVPWSVEIPHTEINFDSGKWDIKSSEAPKLDEAVAVAFHELVALEKVNEAVGANITPRLYIVGYTDTVGSASSNQKLSQARAKAIAEYFRDKGFWAAIYYAGMGERGLRVETPDNTDEVRNRRALYLIGVQDPAPGGQIPARWSQLVGPRSKPANFQLPPLPEQWADYRRQNRGQGGHEGSDGEVADMSRDLGGSAGTGADSESSDFGGVGDPYGAGGGDDGPPAVEGEPGATSKGCAVDRRGVGPFALLLGGLLGWRRRSR